MPIFLRFVSAWVLFHGAFSLRVTLTNEINLYKWKILKSDQKQDKNRQNKENIWKTW